LKSLETRERRRRTAFREIDEAVFKRDWELGVSANKMSKKNNVPKYVLYYHAGRLGLKPRVPGRGAIMVRSDGSLLIPRRICERFGLSKGEWVVFEVLDEDEKTIKIVKA